MKKTRRTPRHADRTLARLDEAMLELASAVAFLWAEGLLHDERRLRRVRNRALRQVPDGAATRALDELVKSLPASKGARRT